jgi:hypothetical protein
MFCIYMDVLLARLSNLHVGCFFGDSFCGALCYADDLTLLAPSRLAAEMLINECVNFAKDFSVKYNPSKCVYICYNDCNPNAPGLSIDGTLVHKSLSANHLGHCIGPKSEKDIIAKGKNKLVSSVNSLFARFGFCSSNVLARLYT